MIKMRILRIAQLPSKANLSLDEKNVLLYGLPVTHVLPLTKAVNGYGNETILFSAGGLRNPMYEVFDGIPIFRTRLLCKPFFWGVALGLLLNWKKFGKIDIIHFHSAGLALCFQFISFLLPKIPVIISYHGAYKHNFFSKLLFRALTPKVDFFFAINPNARNQLREFGVPENKIADIPSGVDLSLFKLKKKRTPAVLFVGRLVAVKGPMLALKAFDLVQKRFPKLKFEIIGDGPLEVALKEFVEKNNLKNRVFFLGQKPLTELPKYYSAVLATVVSGADGRCKVVYESWAAGTPSIVERDPSKIARTLIKLFSDKKYWQMESKRAKELAKKYSWEGIAKKQIAIYKRLISSFNK